MDGNRKILALWAVPRSRSSAFLIMMKSRGDFAIAMEPFESSAYRSEERIIERAAGTDPQFNYGNVLKKLLQRAQAGPLFVKDHAFYIRHIADDTFLSHFRHTFLIRHPGHALPSYFHKWPDVTLKETGYKEQAELFDLVVEKYGEIPPIIDGDELVESPELLIQAYCNRVGISYIPEALKWPRINRDLGIWHEHLVSTQGFEERPDRPYIGVNDDPRLKQLYESCMPYYEKLSKLRIRVK